jgi:integrase
VNTALTNPAWEVVLYTMLLAAHTSCRPCEIAGLQVGRIHVDGEYPYITIDRRTTKTAAGARNVPLNRVALLAIRQLLDRAHKLGASEPHHYLLPRDLSRHTKSTDKLHERRGQGFDPNLNQRSWDTAWSKLRVKAGLPDAEFYSYAPPPSPPQQSRTYR